MEPFPNYPGEQYELSNENQALSEASYLTYSPEDAEEERQARALLVEGEKINDLEEFIKSFINYSTMPESSVKTTFGEALVRAAAEKNLLSATAEEAQPDQAEQKQILGEIDTWLREEWQIERYQVPESLGHNIDREELEQWQQSLDEHYLKLILTSQINATDAQEQAMAHFKEHVLEIIENEDAGDDTIQEITSDTAIPQSGEAQNAENVPGEPRTDLSARSAPHTNISAHSSPSVQGGKPGPSMATGGGKPESHRPGTGKMDSPKLGHLANAQGK